MPIAKPSKQTSRIHRSSIRRLTAEPGSNKPSGAAALRVAASPIKPLTSAFRVELFRALGRLSRGSIIIYEKAPTLGAPFTGVACSYLNSILVNHQV